MTEERLWKMLTGGGGVGDRAMDVSIAVRQHDDGVGIALCMDGEDQHWSVQLDARRARILARKLLAAADGGMTDPWPVPDNSDAPGVEKGALRRDG